VGQALSPANSFFNALPSDLNNLDRVFNGVTMGLRPTKGDEAAAGRSRRINNSDRVFNGASLREPGDRDIPLDILPKRV
jgi:hypothetical protein